MVLLMSIVTYTSPQPPNLKLHTKFLNSNQVFDLYRFGNYTRRSLYSIIGISQKLNSFIRWSDANSILYLNTNLDSLGYGEKASRISLHQIVKKRMMNECEQMDCKAKWREWSLFDGRWRRRGWRGRSSDLQVHCILRVAIHLHNERHHEHQERRAGNPRRLAGAPQQLLAVLHGVRGRLFGFLGSCGQVEAHCSPPTLLVPAVGRDGRHRQPPAATSRQIQA